MKALVLAAGNSTRIASVSGGLPKPLLRVGGRPVIDRALEWLADSGVRDVVVNLHYRPGDVRAALGDGSRLGVRISYSHETEILGTAGAFRALASSWSDTVLVVYGDNLVSFDLPAFRASHRERRAGASIALFDQDRHANSGIAGGRVLLDSEGRIRSFVEGGSEPARGLVNAGVYLLEPSIAPAIAPGFQDFARDVFPALVTDRRLYGYVMEPAGYCIGLDTPESFAVAEQLISTRQVALA